MAIAMGLVMYGDYLIVFILITDKTSVIGCNQAIGPINKNHF